MIWGSEMAESQKSVSGGPEALVRISISSANFRLKWVWLTFLHHLMSCFPLMVPSLGERKWKKRFYNGKTHLVFVIWFDLSFQRFSLFLLNWFFKDPGRSLGQRYCSVFMYFRVFPLLFLELHNWSIVFHLSWNQFWDCILGDQSGSYSTIRTQAFDVYYKILNC